MRIKTQFLVSITIFSVIIVIVGSMVAITQPQITEFSNKEARAREIQTGASDLNYISNNYLLYQDNSSIGLWESKFSSILTELANLNPNNAEQQLLVDTIKNDLDNLNVAFNGVIVFLNNSPRNASVRILPSFQTQWNRMAIQIQALSFNSQQLSQDLGNQSNQAAFENSVATIALIVLFGAFFVTMYILNYRRTLRSIEKLKNEIGVIGSGNLEYIVHAGSKDEVSEISNSVNQMAANLKAITASKVELEREIKERRKAEEDSIKALEQTKLREAEVTALLIAAKTVLQNRSFKSSAQVIFNTCKQLLGATSGYVALLSDNGKDNIVLFLESGGLPCSVDPSLPMPIRGLRGQAYNTGKVTIENSFPDSEWIRFMPEGHVRLENVLFSPLKIEGRTVGIMGIANKPGGFTEHDAQISLAFGDMASIALINSNMIDMLEENQKKLTAYSTNLEVLVEEKTKMLKDSERLAAIGATAGMVGHDIRNPLQAITGDVYLLRSELSSLPKSQEKESMIESLGFIDENVQYVNKIVLDLQDYARPIRPSVYEVNLESLLENVLFKNIFPDNITASCQVENDAKKLITDPELLKRVVSNLVSNALQAMPDGGKLFVRAYPEEDGIEIAIVDSGVGIPEEVKPKLFSPLFTTKSKGQGFGLAVVKRLTEALGGTVTFESEVGKGTTFILHFPRNTNF